jgi:hypothetical protein
MKRLRRRLGRVPAEVFDLDLVWPMRAPELPYERGHPDRIPDDAPGPYRRRPDEDERE